MGQSSANCALHHCFLKIFLFFSSILISIFIFRFSLLSLFDIFKTLLFFLLEPFSKSFSELCSRFKINIETIEGVMESEGGTTPGTMSTQKFFTRPPMAWFSLQAVFRRASAAHFCVIPYSRPPACSIHKTVFFVRKTHSHKRFASRFLRVTQNLWAHSHIRNLHLLNLKICIFLKKIH